MSVWIYQYVRRFVRRTFCTSSIVRRFDRVLFIYFIKHFFSTPFPIPIWICTENDETQWNKLVLNQFKVADQ